VTQPVETGSTTGIDYLRRQQAKYEREVQRNLRQANDCTAEINRQVLLAATVLLGLVAGLMLGRSPTHTPAAIAVLEIVVLGLIVSSIGFGLGYLWVGSLAFGKYGRAYQRIVDWILKPGSTPNELGMVADRETSDLAPHSGKSLLALQTWAFGLGCLLYGVVAAITTLAK
jgi:anti-sigma-K factor RskA